MYFVPTSSLAPSGIAAFKPQDATTNPSLVYKASEMPQYKAVVDGAVAFAKSKARCVQQRKR